MFGITITNRKCIFDLQARLPELQIGIPVRCEDLEEICWLPGVTVDADLVM